MPATPSAGRRYDAAGRRAAAERSRRAVLDACLHLVLRDGYRATTVRAVAERAGVSAETVYKAFGNKRGLMKAVYDTVLAGDDAPVPLGDRPELRAILAIADPVAKLHSYAGFVCGVHERLGGLQPVLAAADPELAEIVAETDRERLTGVTAFVAHLQAVGHLAPGLDPARAADACWALTSPQFYALLVHTRGWPPARYRAQLADLLITAVLTTSA